MEKEKMLAGEWYDANFDETLGEERIHVKDLCCELNYTKPSEVEQRQKLLEKIFQYEPQQLELLSPFQVDYGYNVKLGKQVFINHNCYLMDCATIQIGDNVFIGPNSGLYTANHPLEIQARNSGIEQALPIEIGDNVWLGANVVVLPGVKIGSGTVVSAGSVVTKDLPDNVLAMGTPAKPVKTINN